MSKIILNDGTELIAEHGANARPCYFQGANRDSLEFVFSKNAYPFETLEAIFADKAKIKKITLEEIRDPFSVSNFIYDDYLLRVSMSLVPVSVSPATSDAPEQFEERIFVVLARQTYMEKQLEAILG